ncbi:MAG: hypothetical protein J6P65_06855, partial [Bacteroidales bacterium]|nr:hypothetical protein [Bacteroidales bacterium]
MAEKLELETPTIDAILHWAQQVRHEEIIDEQNHLQLDSPDLCSPLKSGVPCYYGYQTIEEIVD